MNYIKKTSQLSIILLTFIPFYTQAATQLSADCDPNIRQAVTKDEEFPFKYTNPYSIQDCDLGFDFPGFSFDVTLGGFDFCSIAKGVTSQAREKWNDAVDDVNEWTNNTVEASMQDGVGINGENSTGGFGDSIGNIANGEDGGGASSNYDFDFQLDPETGVPIYQMN